MKLRNKKTGEIGLVHCDATMFSNKIGVFIDNNHIDLRNPYKIYSSLTELNEEWEDYKEPKKYWTVECGVATEYTEGDEKYDRAFEAVGLKFDTKEECERAIEKLKAWKRLKDKGFRFKYWTYKMDEPKIENYTYFKIVGVCEDGVRFDGLDLLFEGER